MVGHHLLRRHLGLPYLDTVGTQVVQMALPDGRIAAPAAEPYAAQSRIRHLATLHHHVLGKVRHHGRLDRGSSLCGAVTLGRNPVSRLAERQVAQDDVSGTPSRGLVALDHEKLIHNGHRHLKRCRILARHGYIVEPPLRAVEIPLARQIQRRAAVLDNQLALRVYGVPLRHTLLDEVGLALLRIEIVQRQPRHIPLVIEVEHHIVPLAARHAGQLPATCLPSVTLRTAQFLPVRFVADESITNSSTRSMARKSPLSAAVRGSGARPRHTSARSHVLGTPSAHAHATPFRHSVRSRRK